jgi:hypothetical protein
MEDSCHDNLMEIMGKVKKVKKVTGMEVTARHDATGKFRRGEGPLCLQS